MIILKMFKYLKRYFFTSLSLIKIGNYKNKPLVSGFTLFNHHTNIGTNCSFNGFRVYGNGNVDIGDNFHSGKGCYIVTQIHNYEGEKLPYDNTYITKNIEIEDNVWFGMNVSVLSNCKIGEGSIIQAGSVVVSNIPKFSIVGGNPAKVFKYRDVTHYEKLKKMKLFH